VRHELPKLLGIVSEEGWGGYKGLERREWLRILRGDFGQESLDFDVGEDDVRFPLEGFVVTPFKSISFFRRADEGSGFYQKVLHLNKRELRLVVQEFINTDYQLRERVKPGKPRIV